MDGMGGVRLLDKCPFDFSDWKNPIEMFFIETWEPVDYEEDGVYCHFVGNFHYVQPPHAPGSCFVPIMGI